MEKPHRFVNEKDPFCFNQKKRKKKEDLLSQLVIMIYIYFGLVIMIKYQVVWQVALHFSLCIIVPQTTSFFFSQSYSIIVNYTFDFIILSYCVALNYGLPLVVWTECNIPNLRCCRTAHWVGGPGWKPAVGEKGICMREAPIT